MIGMAMREQHAQLLLLAHKAAREGDDVSQARQRVDERCLALALDEVA